MYIYIYVREKILKLYSIDFIASKKIVLSIYRLKKDLRNNKLDFIEREKKYTKTIIMLDANIRSLLSVSAHVESSLPSRTFIPVSILINFSCLLADLRSTTSHVLRHRVMEKRWIGLFVSAIIERTMVSLVEIPTILVVIFLFFYIK